MTDNNKVVRAGIKIMPGSPYPFTVLVQGEELFGPGHTWYSCATWCSNLIGIMDKDWTMAYNDTQQGISWNFKAREDAALFLLTWL